MIKPHLRTDTLTQDVLTSFPKQGLNGMREMSQAPPLLSPEIIRNHVDGFLTKEQPQDHRHILEMLIDQLERLDFKSLAFPELVQIQQEVNTLRLKLTNPDGTVKSGDQHLPEQDRLTELTKKLEQVKINNKHYLVLSIEHLNETAKANDWGLCKNHDFVYLFNGAYWMNLDKEAFQKFLGDASEKMGVPKFSARFYEFRKQLFNQFLSTSYLPKPESKADTVLINLQNGTFEINASGVQLRRFDRSDFMTYQLPFEYDPKANAPIFQDYLDQVLPDKERQKVLAEYMGFVFIMHGSKRLKEEKALILYGLGANGKSVLYEVVNALMGAENISSHSLQNLTNENGYYRAMIANKLVNYASEISGKLETSIFKQMVSGEPISARLPYGEPMQLSQYAKLIFNCNELPKDVEHTNAFFRRFLIVPFDVTIPEHKQDKNLHNKIIESELSGVFNWVLEGLYRLLEQGRFSECKATQEALIQYKIESSSIQLFIDECGYEKSQENYKLIKDLFPSYRQFCVEDGMRPFSKRNFTKQLRALGYTVDRVTNNQMAVFVHTDQIPF